MSVYSDYLLECVDAIHDIGYDFAVKKPILGQPSCTEVIIEDHKILNFASNNYLSLASHPEVKKAAQQCIEEYGLGSGASRWMSGSSKLHFNLEKAVAQFKGTAGAVLYSSGMLANIGTITQIIKPSLLPAIIKKNGCLTDKMSKAVFFDEANHASLYDACRAAQDRDLKTYYYKRCDASHLESKLKKSREDFKIIITDGVFSDFGNIAPLDKIYPLAKEYNAMLIVDDAHGTGVLGEKGRGTFEHCGIEEAVKDIDVIITGTLSKAAGAEGGFAAGNKKLMNLFRTSRQFIFNTSMCPSIAAGALKALEIMEREPERKEKVKTLSDHLRKRLEENKLFYFDSPSHIIPVLVGDEHRINIISEKLYQEGIYVPCFKFPAAPINKSIFRASLMFDHTFEEIDFLVDKMSYYMKKH